MVQSPAGSKTPAIPDPDSGKTFDLIQVTYAELRKLARSYLSRERPDHTLQPTDLVHETYLQLVDQKRVRWQDQAHFIGTAAQLMRRVLREHARRRAAFKRRHERVTLEDSLAVAGDAGAEPTTLQRALESLAQRDVGLARIVELRFFYGLSIEETASLMGISPATVKRQWRIARAYLYRELNGDVVD
jgi:RNA polymerase sigma-70 factor, ECF subfamily